MSADCPQCGFAIWTPIADLPSSTVGLYDDARYPCRLLVAAREHHDHLDQMPTHAAATFMSDVQRAARALRGWHGVQRVNIAILGNKATHVYAHVIPRRTTDPNVTAAPWDGAEPLRQLPDGHKARVVNDVRHALAASRPDPRS